MDAIRGAKISLGVDPLGGAGVHYWAPIAERYGLNLTVVNDVVDPTFRFMTVDWDGQIRMDPSSPYAMQRLIGLKDRFEIAFACDTDHDRHGIVTRSAGLLPPNHYLAVAIFYLFQHRPKWRTEAAVGKTVVSSRMIDRVAAKLGPKALRGAGWLQVVRGWPPRRFPWLRRGRERGSIFCPSGRQCLDDGQGRDRPGPARGGDHGHGWAGTPAKSTAISHANSVSLSMTGLRRLQPRNKRQCWRNSRRSRSKSRTSRAKKSETILTRAPGNGASIGGLKVIAESGWFAARPSGTEDIYKIYAESFRGADHLRRILEEAQTIVNDALAAAPQQSGLASTTKVKEKP